MKKFTLFLVAMMMSFFSFAAQPKRIYAYGLSSTLVDKVYTFSFNANETPTSGKIIFYDATSSELVGEIALTNPVLGKNDVEIAEYNLPGKGGQQLNWSVELSAAAVTAYEKIYEDAASKYCRGYSNVDVSPESDHFGSVYVGDRVSNVENSKFYVYSPVYSIVKSDGYDLGADNWGFGRFAIASDGTLWLTDYTDNHSGMFLVNPNDLTTSSQFFAGTRYVSTAPKGVIKNGDIETGSSLACATFYGEGANTKLVTVAEDYKNKSFPVAVFNVGNADGTLKTRWETAPDILFSTEDNAAQNFDIKACEKGVWVAQSRSNNQNVSGAASLCFYTWDGTCKWESHQHTDIINGSLGGGIAITPDEKQLIMKIEGNTIAIFDIAWNGTTPTLTKTTSFDCKYPVISSINLDYAGNIVTAAGTGSKFAGTSTPFMRLAVYSNPTNNNTCEVPAKKADVITKKTSRAWAYDLELSLEGDSYTFSFMAATSADATLIFNQDGVEVGTINCGHVSAGLNTITKTHDELLDIIQKSGDFNWSVRMIGEDIVLDGSYLTELTAAGQGLDFYLPQGLVVDNNPESETFSTLFIAEAQGGKLSVGPTHKQGIYHYSQKLAELNPTDQGIIPSNVTLTNGDRQEMHRIAINPKNNHVAFAHNISGKPAVWSVPANNPAGEATNLIAGTAITMPNSICFDENGVLYVMDNANATTGGTLYKVVDGVATKIAQNTIWQHSDNSLAYDGRGGIWIAQSVSNNTWPSYEILSHINSEGNIDWKSSDYKSTALFSNGNGDGYSKRGQVAYSMKDDLLVFGGNCRTHIFQVTYDANTGIPSLGTTYKYRTPFIGGSKSTANIDGLSFDYAGDLYVMCATRERLYKYVVPTNNNTCTTPAKKLQVITLVSTTPEYSVTINVNGNGTITGANTGTYLEGSELTLIATPAEHYDFVNWTEDGEVVSATAEYSFTVTKDIELTANFQEHAKYTITAVPNDENMGTVTGGDTYYVGESVTLKATAKSGYVFAGWADGEKNATRIVTVSGDATYIANFQAIAPRAWAYDMKLGEEGDNYTFIFKATTAGQATITFNDKDGNALAQPASQTMEAAAGENKFTIAKSDFESGVDAFWSITMDGDPIPAIAEVTDQTRGIYDFYNMMGVVVDNNTNSKDFGKIYIQQSYQRSYADAGSGYDGITTRANEQTSGIFVYNQDLDELNDPSNVGYKPTLPSGYDEIGSSYNTFQRLNIDPKTGDLVFSHAVLGKPAVFAINRDDMTGDVTNLLTGVADMTRSVAHCFDVDGTLFVMNFADNKGTIYKVINGEATKFTETSGRFINANITIASDGRGGFWVSQNRGQIDYYYQLAHVTSEGAIDWSVYDDLGTYVAPQGNNPGKLGTSSLGWLGSSSRGALAYDAERNILAQGRNGKVELYTVSYEPTITLTPLHTIASNGLGNNIDGLAFDYAGDLYVVNSSKEKFQKFVLPTNDNTCTVPAPALEAIRFTPVYTVNVESNNNEWGIANGGGTFEEGETATITAVAATNYKFVNWTKGGAEVFTENPHTFAVTESATYVANFVEKTKYTINVTIMDDAKMGTVEGAGTYYEGTEVTLTAKANAGYVFVDWGDGNTDESRTFTAGVDLPETLTANFKVAVPRAWAYDLRLDADTDPTNYIFTFKTTSAGTATLIFKDKDGNIQNFGTHTATANAAEEKTITIAKSTFETATKDIYWSVALAGEAITKMAEITDPTKGIYNFYVPQGVAVDNSPNSMYFGRIYVAEGTTGGNDGLTEMAKQMTAGLFVYNQALEKVQPATGYTGIIPQNVTFNTNKPTSTDEINIIRQQMHRVAVDPVTGEVAFAYYKSPATAIYSMNPDDLAGNAQNLIEGSSITYANSLCFDSEGTLYVMNNANTGLTGGQIYKVQDDEVTLFAAHDKNNQWAVYDNAMASDGRGGLWIAQNRYEYDYPILSHVSKDGVVDFAVNENLNDWFPNNNTGSSYRGQLAYNEQEDILAFAGNKMVTLFTVEYDGNGKPTINKLMSTPLLGGGNIDGVAFDYAGDLYVASASAERLYKFVVPTTDNTCTVPAPESQIIKKEARYTVTVVANPEEMGTVSGGGTEFLAGDIATLTATANDGYRFVNWTYGTTTSTDNPLELTVEGDITVTAHFEAKPLAIEGTVKRAVQIGESTVVLTHEANGNPHLYKVVDGTLVAEISQEGVIARDIDNAGDYLSISDIAATEDGKLVACNYVRCQFAEGNVESGYKRGTLTFYVWNDLASNPFIWFQSKASSNSVNSDQGYTMAVAGTSSNADILVTGVHNTQRGVRMSHFSVIGGVYQDTENGQPNLPYYYFLGKKFKNTSAGVDAAVYREDAHGANFQLSVSPLAKENWIMDAELMEPSEFTNPQTSGVDPVVNSNLTEGKLGKKFNGATYLTVLGRHLMVAPYADGENVAGVTVLDITNGLDQAEEMGYAELTSPLTANAAATAVKVNGDDLTITLVVDNQVYMFNIDLNMQYTRDVTNGNFGTICLPYASASTNGAEFYEVAGKETDKVLLDQVTKLEAGRPYIFRATAGKLVVIYEGEEAPSPGNYNGLYGTFTDNTTVTPGNYIVYQNELRLCGEGCYINANRAYLILAEVGAPQPVQAGRRRISMSLQGENQTTALDNITEEGTLPAEQATKIIHNGQLIIIRDGVMYNAQGQKL